MTFEQRPVKGKEVSHVDMGGAGLWATSGPMEELGENDLTDILKRPPGSFKCSMFRTRVETGGPHHTVI